MREGSRAGLVVAGVGLSAHTGSEPAALLGAVVGGIVGLKPDGVLTALNDEGEEASVSIAPAVDMGTLEVTPRIIALCSRALAGLVTDLAGRLEPTTRVTVHVVLPSLETARGGIIDENEIIGIIHEAGLPGVELKTSIHRGAESHSVVMDMIAEQLSNDETDICIFGGIDSLINIPTVYEMAAEQRLRLYDDEGGYGLGEGAAFVALTSEEGNTEYRNSVVSISAWGHGSDRDKIAEKSGLSIRTAIQKALKHGECDPSLVGSVIHDCNVTRQGAIEWYYTTRRLWPNRVDEQRRLAMQLGEMDPPLDLNEPVREELGLAAAIGCTGVASLPIQTVLGIERFYFRHPRVEYLVILDTAETVSQTALLMSCQDRQDGRQLKNTGTG